MSASDPGKISAWTEPATGVRYFYDLILGNMSKQESSNVSITGGLATGLTLSGKVQEITEAEAISLDAGYVDITGPASSTYAVTLAAPSRGGQMLVIEMTATTSTNAVTLDLTNVVGGSASSTATFDAAGETLVLVSNGSKWVVLKEQGVALT